MNLDFPTRNEARAILLGLYKSYPKNREGYRSILESITLYTILLYQNKYKIDFVTFVFTNALVDVFPDMNVENENSVEPKSIMRGNLSSKEIDLFFIEEFGYTFEDLISGLASKEHSHKIELSNIDLLKYNPYWFNNSDQYINPLLNSYQRLKRERGMMFQKVDIRQIPIDYSLILCYNHFIQNGFITRGICDEITRTLVHAANECLNFERLTYDDIARDVFKDLEKPHCVRAAFQFFEYL